MKKTDFSKILKEATKEFKKEKNDRLKQFLKSRMQEYEMAKATVQKIEKQFKEIEKNGITDESFLLEYDE